jgi:hypothetical protein
LVALGLASHGGATTWREFPASGISAGRLPWLARRILALADTFTIGARRLRRLGWRSYLYE